MKNSDVYRYLFMAWLILTQGLVLSLSIQIASTEKRQHLHQAKTIQNLAFRVQALDGQAERAGSSYSPLFDLVVFPSAGEESLEEPAADQLPLSQPEKFSSSKFTKGN